jgi:hypothetical protein
VAADEAVLNIEHKISKKPPCLLKKQRKKKKKNETIGDCFLTIPLFVCPFL